MIKGYKVPIKIVIVETINIRLLNSKAVSLDNKKNFELFFLKFFNPKIKSGIPVDNHNIIKMNIPL